MSALWICLMGGDSLIAGHGKQDREEWTLFTVARKCFSCCFKKQTFEKDEELLSEGESSLFSKSAFMESKIEDIPTEVLQIISMNLSPLDIIHLSTTSWNFKIKLDVQFWEAYIRDKNQRKWTPSVPAIKVAFASFFFEQGRIEKAAKLGFPKAIQILSDKREKGPTYRIGIDTSFGNRHPSFF